MNRKTFTTKRIVIDALLAAMYILLSYLSITIGNVVKLTFESLPIVIGALMFGPLDGALTALVGTLVYQMTGPFGITPTAPLWMLPFIAEALFVGFCAKKYKLRNTKKQIMVISIVGELICFVFNTLAIYVDSKVYGYYTPMSVWGLAGVRFLIAVVKAVAYGFILPPLLNALAAVTGRRKWSRRKTQKQGTIEPVDKISEGKP